VPPSSLAVLRLRARRIARALFGLPGAPALQDITGQSDNPGGLRSFAVLPPGLSPGAPLVVLLHGCTQDAALIATGTGWGALAETAGFALLVPQQTEAKNPRGCFNWFLPAESRRDMGEAASIRAAIAALIARHGLDPARVYVVGLSAGGAMTSQLLAAYPEVFAAGAIIAGLPAGAAEDVPSALAAMQTGAPRPAEAWAAVVRAASPHTGPWPRVSVWHGARDPLVNPLAAEGSVAQWRLVHGLAESPTRLPGATPAHRWEVWRDAAGQTLLESNLIAGLGHGVPIGGRTGRAGKHFLPVGIDSTRRIASFFGLLNESSLRSDGSHRDPSERR
jgi:poly(hydroxyalkanoate) depolymerase family esterase